MKWLLLVTNVISVFLPKRILLTLRVNTLLLLTFIKSVCLYCTNDDQSKPSSCDSDINLVLIGDKAEVLCSPVVAGMSVNLPLWQ